MLYPPSSLCACFLICQTGQRISKCLLVGAALVTHLTNLAHAQQLSTLEGIAAEIALRHNNNSASLVDDWTVATSAKAVGKNVVLYYIIRAKKSVALHKLGEFKSELYKEIVPAACKVNANNEAFKRGLYYTFVYHNTYGEKLAEFVVNRAVCEKTP